MDRDKTEIMKLKTDLATPQPVYHYGGRSYTVAAGEGRSGQSLRALQDARRHAGQPARHSDCPPQEPGRGPAEARGHAGRPAASWKSTWKTWKPSFKMVEVAQTTSEFNIDDSQLGRVKDLIADVRTRLNVAERLANSQTDFERRDSAVRAGQSDNIVDQVTEYFNAEQPAAKWPTHRRARPAKPRSCRSSAAAARTGA